MRDNLSRLGLDALDVVNLRVGGLDRPTPGSVAEPFGVLAELQQQGLIRHLGLSTVSAEQVAEAQQIAPVVCVQNSYNIANREDDALVDALAAQGIAFVPYFPLGGFSPLQSEVLDGVAARLGTTPMAVALAWLLQRSPNILLIPGTSSSSTCGRTCGARRWSCRPTRWPSWTPSAPRTSRTTPRRPRPR